MVDLERSQLAVHEGDLARARAIALAVTRAEPRNIDAWLAYGSASPNDPPAFTFAFRHLQQLAPPVPSSRRQLTVGATHGHSGRSGSPSGDHQAGRARSRSG